MSLPVVLVVAVARNGVIGRAGGLPWHQSADLKRFKAVTMGKPIIMGRRTWDSIGRPLPGRTSIVVSRDPSFAPPGAVVARSLEEAIAAAGQDARRRGAAEIAVIGGHALFRDALPLASRLYLTEVDAAPEGDVGFPAIDPAEWREVRRERHPAGAGDDHPFAFVELERRAAPRS